MLHPHQHGQTWNIDERGRRDPGEYAQLRDEVPMTRLKTAAEAIAYVILFIPLAFLVILYVLADRVFGRKP